MKYQLISKKTMREKDFAALKNKKVGYQRFKAPATNKEHKYETLFRTPRGFFMMFSEFRDQPNETLREIIIGEVSITTAQKWLDECGINYNIGW